MKPTTLQTVLTSAIAIAFGCASPSHADLLLYEGFQTGANGYTADAALYGQTYRGFGEASGTWGAASGYENAAIVRATGLKHVVASSGGRANFTAQTGGGVILSPDRSAQGTFATAGLYDSASGTIGGGSVEGTMYVSFLVRANETPVAYNWFAFQTYRGGAELQALGGMPSLATACYGIFGKSGAQQLKNNGGTGATITGDTATRLFVAKITFHANAADDLTVWMDPDPAKGVNQDASVYMYSRTALENLSFDEFRLRGGSSKTWEYDEIRVGTAWADITPATAETLASESFMTGAGGYTANAVLPGQTARGEGLAGSAWVGDDANDSSVSADGLKYRKIFADGGKAVHSGNGNKGTSTSFDASREAAMSLAGLLNSDGQIGGGNVGGPLFVSFLLRFHNPGNVEPSRWGGLGIYRGNTEVQALGGKHFGAHGYSLFSAKGSGTGNVDLRNATSYVTVDTTTRLFVAKITFNPGTNDHLKVWLDPVVANGEAQDATVASYSTNYVGNLAFDNFSLRAGSSGALAAIDFDEIRFGRTWASVTPNPPPPTVICVR